LKIIDLPQKTIKSSVSREILLYSSWHADEECFGRDCFFVVEILNENILLSLQQPSSANIEHNRLAAKRA
jgi:hypothetical protein